jgi:transcriptional regulator with PAS, ATPase and Fis domain
MPMALQPKLLRVLADGRVRRLGGTHEFEFDVRVLAATNRDPLKAIDENKLREDLYYRLNGCKLRFLRSVIARTTFRSLFSIS